ncbi:hypothetical protein Tel_01220 [Candidatus Tenderia electrophaga]|jgi:diguanylate cyclase (GGDEF)-like protein/PAS domain S-box-containing protein|uniref:cyclic-guanylate-specific phosphodiesterase n=1 Tax=Candidatus Tenderia electrophaga TaxID=1748243 RepID=A0A0S2T9L6_9GAMM|nr:hypothetical protein Tel_01220 [Candidatus Tenderia electrophaga]
MGGLLNRFTSRMVLGELLIHGLLGSVVFVLILPALAQHFQQQFLDRSMTSALQLAATLEHYPRPPQDLADIRAGKLNLIHLNIQDGSITAIETDAAFGDQDDHTYHIAVPLKISGQNYILQLGYDERDTLGLIGQAQRYGLYIVLGYICLAVLMAAIMGPQLTRPLIRLREAARDIAAGKHSRRLELHSGIRELRQLAHDLESMRAELVNQSEALATREARLSTIMANVADALITVDKNGNVLSFNLAAERSFAYNASEVVGQDIHLLFSNSFTDIFAGGDNDTPLDIEQAAPYETLGKRKTGERFYVEASINEICQLDSSIFIIVCRDISERKQAEAEIKSLQEDLERRVIKRTRELAEANKELRHQALHDSLTSLPNRLLLHDRLHQAIRGAKREGRSIALMISDLDRFKEINDTLGHHFGDLLLQQVAVRLRGVLRDSDTVARLGGDEFAILLPDIEAPEQVTQAASKIAAAIDLPFIFEDQNIHIGISMGISLFPQNSEDASTLMRQADVAMYVAKRSNIDFALYRPDLDEHSLSRLSMAGELRRGLQQEEFVLHYQPTIDLRSDQVIGVEALARWQHPDKGLIQPDDFILLAEQTGHIRELTAYVLREALRQAQLWNSAGLRLRISVNLSARSLHDTELCQHIGELLQHWQLEAEQLQLEITERALMYDPMQAMQTLSQLHDMGVKLSIDDFGTGYSSMAYLKQLPVNEIKVDQSFVQAMLEHNEDKVIVRSTIDLAHNMGHQVIAEGVDNEATLELLREMGCDLAQGFHIHPPARATDLRQWLLHTGWRNEAGLSSEQQPGA